jgi:hypothetical protein
MSTPAILERARKTWNNLFGTEVTATRPARPAASAPGAAPSAAPAASPGPAADQFKSVSGRVNDFTPARAFGGKIQELLEARAKKEAILDNAADLAQDILNGKASQWDVISRCLKDCPEMLQFRDPKLFSEYMKTVTDLVAEGLDKNPATTQDDRHRALELVLTANKEVRFVRDGRLQRELNVLDSGAKLGKDGASGWIPGPEARGKLQADCQLLANMEDTRLADDYRSNLTDAAQEYLDKHPDLPKAEREKVNQFVYEAIDRVEHAKQQIVQTAAAKAQEDAAKKAGVQK